LHLLNRGLGQRPHRDRLLLFHSEYLVKVEIEDLRLKALTLEITRPPTSLAINLAGSKEFDKHPKNAASRGVRLIDLLIFVVLLPFSCTEGPGIQGYK
jgi:hypothetical protein